MENKMDQSTNDNISKFLSYVLRHQPQEIKLELDESGWASIEQLIENSKTYQNRSFTKDDILHVVETNMKKRFDVDQGKLKIRANQGHSVEVFLDLPSVKPPEFLYHGTATRFLPSISLQGLKAMERHDVHLSFDKNTAISVGQRHGKPVVLKIQSQKMFELGYEFKCTKNNVWLTKVVPFEFVEVI
jgi:putative RNA 2'-phosphotransferase